MSDIIEETTHSIRRTIRDHEYVLEFLTVYDRAELMQTNRLVLREKLKANLKDAAMSSEQAFSELQSFDEARVTERDWIEFVNDVRSDVPIIEKSLAHHIPVADAGAVAKTITPSLALKATLCGLEMVSRTQEDSPHPTEVPGSQAPGTGNVYGS